MRYANILDPSEVEKWLEENRRPPDAVRTHLPSLNAVCRDNGGGLGLAMGWHVVIGGDTGAGKSLFALNLCRDAVKSGERVGFVSLEMSVQQLKNRFYSILTGVPVRELEPGASYSEESAMRVHEFVMDQTTKHGDHPFFINEEQHSGIGQVIGLMESWLDQGCRVFVIDYLQLCSSSDQENLSRELVDISTKLCQWAHNHGVLTIALSQYNYGALKSGLKPAWHSLYGSARIGQDSDLCLCLDHTRRERIHGEGTSRTYLIVSKNRHGDDGEIPIEWNYRTLRSREGLPDEVSEWPA